MEKEEEQNFYPFSLHNTTAIDKRFNQHLFQIFETAGDLISLAK